MSSARSFAAWLTLATVLAGAAASARSRVKETPELDAERDRLIARIVAGEQLEQSAAAYKALVAKRDAIIPTSRKAQAAHRERLDTRRAWNDEYSKTADHEVAWRCRLSTDPKDPHKMLDGWRGDWGRVVRKEKVRLPPKNVLDEGEEWLVYELEGQKRTYRFRAHGFGAGKRKAFEAEKGDLVLVCDGGRTTERRLPESWQQEFQTSGFAVKLARPPKIAEKTKWRPLHITDNALFWAVKDVRWKFPPEDYVLSVIEVLEDLGGGRYLIDTLQDVTFIAEVPAKVKNRELMVPDRKVWAIMGNARFDPALKALVLTVEDLEARYVEELAPPGDDD